MVDEYFDVLLSVCRMESASLTIRYKRLRDLLERICRDQMADNSLQMTDLSARISFVSAKSGLSFSEQNRLHTFRLTSNAILNNQKEPVKEELLRDIKTLAFFIKKFSGDDIPAELYRLLPQSDATYLVKSPGRRTVKRMRVCFQYADESYLYVMPVDEIPESPLRVRYNIPEINEEFAGTCEILWQHAQLNLLDVSEDEQGILTPGFIVLEPDYLLDVSSLAECFKDYGHHPGNYQLNKLRVSENTSPLLLGNIANLFLDECLYATGEPDYYECMQKAFRRYPVELASCADLQDPEKEKTFFEECKRQFDHIKETVFETFDKTGYNLDRNDAVLEPSYICEALGLQGRLDYMQQDMSAFIEMKSGKADEYSLRGKIEPRENNRVQMSLYQAMLQYSMGVDHREVNAYLFYTRYPLLYPARSSWALVRRVIDLRNRIISDEYGIQLRNSIHYTSHKFKEIDSEILNERQLSGRFWDTYLRPEIDRFNEKLNGLNVLERAYFFSQFNFITKELYTSKSGDTDYESRAGASALWLSTLAEKSEAGEILYDLTILENHMADPHKASVVLSRKKGVNPDAEFIEGLPNFRVGDAIILYQRNSPGDNVTNKMLFKGNIEALTDTNIHMRLRATQRNKSVLPSDSLYAIEHDVMDTTFRSMFAGLGAFLAANKDRRDLILGQRPARINTEFESRIACAKDDLDRVVLKAQAAQDFFLLVGPPGTGKTSQALRRMVETFHKDNKQILLLAYTNRAVDEICKALLHIHPEVDFIRVGSELPCDPGYRDYLLENKISDCCRREEVMRRIDNCRIFVGTVATFSGKTDIFRIKSFDVAIIDEASQILEAQLLPILCARNSQGDNVVDKFILIGDHKQLPAVVMQKKEQSEVWEESLRSIGVRNLRDSLFERLYYSLTIPGVNSHMAQSLTDMLCLQGRMHPQVAIVPDSLFYGGKLRTLGLPHQQEELIYRQEISTEDALSRRIAFIPSIAEADGASMKINRSEAMITAGLAKRIFAAFGDSFDPSCSLGIITPYRSQIALIRKELTAFGEGKLNDILIDTVERFQGSERDVIIYSCCINRSYQLRLLPNIMEENGILTDRKLNVALTRARKQIFITGVPDLIKTHSIYSFLLHYAFP